jgi:hypothetical protein
MKQGRVRAPARACAYGDPRRSCPVINYVGAGCVENVVVDMRPDNRWVPDIDAVICADDGVP